MSQQKTVLRHIRRTREITLDVIAHATKINRSTLSLGERGLLDFTPDQKAALSAYFGIPADELLAPYAGEEAVVS